jgi:hypothetical protein
VGVQGAKPPEADELLRVKGVFSLIYDNEHINKICKKKFQRGGGRPPLRLNNYSDEADPCVVSFTFDYFQSLLKDIEYKIIDRYPISLR